MNAPLAVLLHRVRNRNINNYGKTAVQQSQIAAHKQSVEPLPREGATLELDSRQSVEALAHRIEKLLWS